MSKIYLATRDQAVLHATSVTINQSTIVLGGIQLPVDNQLITFTLSATIDSPEFISIDNISYPLRNTSNAMVESLLESVCYSATYSNGYFFVMLGGGGGKIEQFTRNQETIFPTADGQHTFTLTKGVYSVGSNCLDVTVMGVPQPHSAFTEDSETQFTLNSSFIITKDTQIDVSYMLVSTMSNAETPKGAQMKVDALETEIDGKLATLETNFDKKVIKQLETNSAIIDRINNVVTFISPGTIAPSLFVTDPNATYADFPIMTTIISEHAKESKYAILSANPNTFAQGYVTDTLNGSIIIYCEEIPTVDVEFYCIYLVETNMAVV